MLDKRKKLYLDTLFKVESIKELMQYCILKKSIVKKRINNLCVLSNWEYIYFKEKIKNGRN